MEYRLNLQQFAGEEAAAAPAPAGGAETATAAGAETAAPAGPVMAGEQLADGQTVKNAQVAAALDRQMKRHPELRNVYGKGQPEAPAPAAAAPAEKSVEERWAEAKKGEFASLYGRDVQNAVQDRFRNQENYRDKLEKLEPALKVLRERAGVASNEDLAKQILDDDSLYEEEANKRGMTIPAYKEMVQLEAQMHQMQEAEARRQENQRYQQHFSRLQEQARAMAEIFPDFDLQRELQNPRFFRMTSPEGGVSVEDAYYAIHHRELAPQMMAYGMQRARVQMGQTIQARGNRPAEGAMKTQGQAAAEVRIDPRNMTRAERAEIKRQVRMGKRVSFD